MAAAAGAAQNPVMKTLPLAAALALGACAHSPAPPANDIPASLAAAESAFAAHSLRTDMRQAFLAAFDADGVMPRGGWVVSNDFLKDRPAPPIVLDWKPVYVEASASGDFGLSTGPSKIISKSDAALPPRYGQFVSIWRRSPGGPWKVAVDLGVSHAEPSLWDQPLEAGFVPGPGAPAAAAGLAAAEARFTEVSAASGLPAAHSEMASPRLRFYREGTPPVLSKAAALASPALSPQRLAWTVERIEVAKAGDLGYARGRYAAAATPGTTLGWYLRVWRFEGGAWRVALEIVNDAPKT